MDKDTTCPCCRSYKFQNINFYEVCPVCKWIDDLVQRNEPDYKGGANELSLNQHRTEWEKKRKTA